jgi:hypothetical protein
MLSYINSLSFGNIWEETRGIYLTILATIVAICIIILLSVIFPYIHIIIGCVCFISTITEAKEIFNLIKAKSVLKDMLIALGIMIAINSIILLLPVKFLNIIINIVRYVGPIMIIGLTVIPVINFFAIKAKKFIVKEKLLVTDRLRWRAWSQSSQKPMTCHELYAVINIFCSRYCHTSVIKYIRERRLLIATKGTEASLKKLALEVEVFLQNKQELTSECPILVEQANYETLDEIYLLLEDIRFSLHGNTVSA